VQAYAALREPSTGGDDTGGALTCEPAVQDAGHGAPTPTSLKPLCGSITDGAWSANPDPGGDARTRVHGGEGVPSRCPITV
jgi:hypothetical protein